MRSLGQLGLVLIPMALLGTFAITPLLVATAKRYNLCDRPDGSCLKIHDVATPNIGGLAILASVMVCMVLTAGPRLEPMPAFVLSGCVLLTAIGILDDKRDLNPFVKLGFQGIAAFAVIAAGVIVRTFSSELVNVLITTLLIVGSVNATNLLDGMDGLATGVAAVCALALGIILTLQGAMFGSLLAFTLFGALLGFLPYNFHPARIFLGNGGSNLVGYLLGILAVLTASKPGVWSYLVSPVLVLGLQFSDTAAAIARRLRSGRGVFGGDRDHFYDRLVREGLSQRQAALVSYALSTCLGFLGLALIGLFR